MTLVAIDLGTTNSLIAVFTEKGSELIPNAMGEFLTPSAVGLNNANEIVVGVEAKNRLVTHPEKTHARFKRFMGTNKDFKLGRKTYRAEELSAMVLRSLKSDAERHLGTKVQRAIISVPAYFNDVQRKATYAAGEMAGLKVERLINEPTAAALAYGLNSKDDENTFIVIDLGGGTFDVSILEIFEGIMEVRSSAGDAFLGGEDFTDAIVKDFGEQIGSDFEALSPSARANLRDLADRAKKGLSEKDAVKIKFNTKSKTYELDLSRDRFEEISKDLIKKLRLPIQRAISDAGLRAENIDRVVMVGGATRMDIVRQHITRLLKLFPEHRLDPDHVIALGAAVQAGLVDRHEALEDVVMTDVCPFTLGTEVAIELPNGQHEGGHFQPVIERNTVIPVSRVVTNGTIRKGQREVTLQIFQGESAWVRDNVPLGTLNVKLSPKKDEFEYFDIRFTYDVSGILEVLVTVHSSQKTERLILEGNPGALSKAEIDKRFKELEKLKVHPKDKAENSAVMSRLERAYENQLGDIRQVIQRRIAEFSAVLETQKETDIALMRDELMKWVESIENMDIF